MALTFNLPSQIVVQTAAEWAVDATVYSAKRILVTSDEYYGNSDQRKIKIADGTQVWASLQYFLEEVNDFGVVGDLTLTGSFIAPTGDTISLTANTNNLTVGSEILINLDADGNYDLTGIAGGVDGSIKLLYNDDTSNIITLKNFTTSTVGNRFDFYPAADFVLNPKQLVFLYYTSGRWRMLRESIATSTVTGLLSSTDWNTFNGKQDALVSGTNIKTINGTSILGSGDLVVSGSVSTLIKSAALITHTGTTSETKVFSQLVTANTVITGDLLRFLIQFVPGGGTGNKSLRVYVNSSDSLVGATQIFSNLNQTSTTSITIRNASVRSSSGISVFSINYTNEEFSSINSTNFTTYTVDWTTNQYIIFSLQLATSGDTALINHGYVLKIR